MEPQDNKPIEIPIRTENDGSGFPQDDFRVQNTAMPTKKPWFKGVAFGLVALMVLGVAFGGGNAWMKDWLEKRDTVSAYYLEARVAEQAQSQLSAEEGVLSTSDIVERVGPSVVAITSKVLVNNLFSEQVETGAGSGVIFNVNKDSVLVLTNNHVIENSNELVVALDAEHQYTAELVGLDSVSDLAVIKIPRSSIPSDILLTIKPIVFGDSDKLKVGEKAIAIGNPLGYDDTVTVGVISAVNREVALETGNRTLIQTDAAINPGNSGGALVNERGELIGINTVKISDTAVEGIGFAIPINTAKPIVEQLLEKGYVSRPYIGVSGRDIDEETAALYELPVGVIVLDVVKGSPAENAGLKRGDVIVGFKGMTILGMEQLIAEIAECQVGEKVALTYIRDGKDKFETTLILAEKNHRQ